MGPGIAAVVALAGCTVTLVGRSPDSVARGEASFRSALAFLAEHGIVSVDEASAAAQRLRLAQGPQAAAPADLVIESIVENLAIKQQFFRQMESIFDSHTILASNTSGLRISDIAALMERPERAVTTHFWNPGHLMPLVEVIQGEKTSNETVDRAYRFLKRCGKQPIIGRKDLAGQIANRLQHALVREAIYMVQEGIASAEDVETAVKAGFGLRLPVYGPLEHGDAVGLDLMLVVQNTILPSLCNATEALPLLQSLVASGNLGASTGQGFYNWHQRSIEQLRRERDLFLVERVKAAKQASKET